MKYCCECAGHAAFGKTLEEAFESLHYEYDCIDINECQFYKVTAINIAYKATYKITKITQKEYK